MLSWVLRLSFALKWFCPGARATSLPFLVTLILFKNDLFDFMSLSSFSLNVLSSTPQVLTFLLTFFDNRREAFETFFDFLRYFIGSGEEFKESFQTFLEEVLV